MTSPLEPRSSMWGIPPTISHKFEPSNDLVCLVMWNLNEGTGMTLLTSRPFVVFIRLANKVVTGISARDLNEALANLMRAGACVVERDGVKFMFYLAYEEDKDNPLNQPWEVDPKLAVSWERDFAKIEGLVLQSSKNTPPVADEDNQPPVDPTGFLPV